MSEQHPRGYPGTTANWRWRVATWRAWWREFRSLWWLLAFLVASPLVAHAQTLTIAASAYTGISTPGPVLKPSTGAMNFFSNGQWMTYSVTLPVAGRYRVSLQVATIQSGTRWSAELDGVTLGVTPVTTTTDWNTYVWQAGPIVLVGAGTHTVKLTSVQQYFDPLAIRLTMLEPIVGLGGAGTPGPPGPAGKDGAPGVAGKDGASVCTPSATDATVWQCPALEMPGLHVTGDAIVDGNIGAKYQ